MQANRMLSPLLGFALATFLAADASAQWSNIGIARLRLPTGGCDTPFGPANGELFAISANSWSEDSSALTLHRLYCIDGTVDRTRVDWSQRTGAWQVAWSYAGFLDTLTITIAAYPDPALVPLTEHRGLVLLDDESSESDGWLQTNVAQEIATPVLRPRVGENEILWAPPAFAGTSGTCESGGELVVPFFTGWNVYRLLRSDVPPGISTPDHYLCGPDLDCRTTADNGFVAFVPHVVAPDGLIHYSDTAIPSDPTLADYVYAVQPVKRGASRGGDADGDTITDEDLNGDGIPEFVDPAWVVGQNVARGLTGRIPAGPGFRKPILISPDSVTARDVRPRAQRRAAQLRLPAVRTCRRPVSPAHGGAVVPAIGAGRTGARRSGRLGPTAPRRGGPFWAFSAPKCRPGPRQYGRGDGLPAAAGLPLLALACAAKCCVLATMPALTSARETECQHASRSK